MHGRWILTLALLSSAGCSSDRPRNEMKTLNDVTVLATPHSAMLSNPNYSVRDFTSAIAQFHPDIILAEVRARHDGPIEGSLDGGVEQSLVYAMAKHLGAKVIPIDWYGELPKNVAAADPWAPMNQAQRDQAMSLRAVYSRKISTLSLAKMNGPDFQKNVRAYFDYVEPRGLIAGRERMDQICMNLREQLIHLSKVKVMVIFGAEQKYALDDCIDTTVGQRPRPVATWYSQARADVYKVPKAVKESAVNSILGAESLLDKRLRANYYPVDMKARGVSKMVSLKGWVRAVEEL